jgi:hypothetical protein
MENNTAASSLVSRDAQICDLWLNQGKSVNYIGRLYGLKPCSVQAVIDRAGLSKAPRTPTSSRKFADQKVISSLHAQIGHDINHARNFKLKQSVAEFADAMRISRMRLRKIEIGIEDATLSELLRIAEAIGVSFETLTTPRNRS